MDNSGKVLELCQSWRDAVTQKDGSMVVGSNSEQYRILRNGFKFHDMDYSEIRASCVGLTSTLLLPGKNTIVMEDHVTLWSWVGQVLCGRHRSSFESSHDRPRNSHIRELLGLCFHGVLANADTSSAASWEAQQGDLKRQSWHKTAWLMGNHTVLAYLSFPILEALTKRHCSSFVESDGLVIRSWETSRINKKNGQPILRPQGSKCSSLYDLLKLLTDHVAAPDLQSDLRQIETHLSTFSNEGTSGFQVLYDWRNGSLHGASLESTIGGTLLNLVSLLALELLESDYDSTRREVLESLDFEIRSPRPNRWLFYPPGA